MKRLKHKKSISTLLTIYFLFSVTLQAQESNTAHGFVIELTQGQLLTIIEPLNKENSQEAVKKYYQTAIPLAQKHGFKNEGTLVSQKTLVGKFAPPGVVFATWPNRQSEQSFLAEPEWPNLKEMRPLAWQELKIFTAEVSEDTVLSFDPDKHYTLAIAWFDPEHPNDYLQYLDNIESVLLSSGGRFMYKMKNPTFEKHASEQKAPNQLTIVEWDSVDGLQQLQAKEQYQKHVALLENGVVDFELHLLFAQ